jgi:DNA-binding CsgD family transcriptional regulator
MRVLLVGPPADRTRVRSDLAGSDMEIVGEFPTITAARASHLRVDAIVMTPAVDDSGVMLGERATPGDETSAEPLTAREHQVLDLLAEGLPNKAIAGRLGISDQTVKFHVASICGKLGAANRTEAVRRAVRRGLITL